MQRDLNEARRLASDPSTPLAVLHELAMHHPEVHALIAENPSTYPDLLTWLSSRGNPDVNAALARRAVAKAESAAPHAPSRPQPATPSPTPASSPSQPSTTTPGTAAQASGSPLAQRPDDPFADEATQAFPAPGVRSPGSPDAGTTATAALSPDVPSAGSPTQALPAPGSVAAAAGGAGGAAVPSAGSPGAGAAGQTSSPAAAQEAPTQAFPTGSSAAEGASLRDVSRQSIMGGRSSHWNYGTTPTAQTPYGAPNGHAGDAATQAGAPGYAASPGQQPTMPMHAAGYPPQNAPGTQSAQSPQYGGPAGAPPAIAPQGQYGAPSNEVFPPQATLHEEERRRGVPVWVWVAVVVVLVLGGVIWAITQLGGSDDDAEASPTSPPAETSEPPAEEPPAEEDPASDGATLEELVSSAVASAQASTCNPDEDGGTLETFANGVADIGGAWSAAATDGAVSVLTHLQERCNAGYAVGVVSALGDDGFTAAVGESWISPVRPAPSDASEASGFSAPSGNIACELDGNSAHCTIESFDFSPGGNCSAGSPATVFVDEEAASFDCDASADSGPSLDYGEAVTNGIMACTSGEDGISCWNTLTGAGFKVARAAANFDDQEWGPGRQ